MSAATDEAVLVRLKTVPEKYGVSYTVVYEAVRSGELPAIKPFREWLIEPAAIREWLQTRHEAQS